jgi:hypothetical protein
MMKKLRREAPAIVGMLHAADDVVLHSSTTKGGELGSEPYVLLGFYFSKGFPIGQCKCKGE